MLRYIILVLCLLLVGCATNLASNNNTHKKQPSEINKIVEEQKSNESIVNSEITDVQKMSENMAIESIKEYNEVRDAAIAQEGSTFSLVIIVDYSVSKDYAKDIGDNFIRLVKSLIDDISPGKEIGKGKYNYLISVYYPALHKTHK